MYFPVNYQHFLCKEIGWVQLIKHACRDDGRIGIFPRSRLLNVSMSNEKFIDALNSSTKTYLSVRTPWIINHRNC